MKEFTYTITDPVGIHARPAGQLMNEASRFICDISIETENRIANAKKVINIIGLGAGQGQNVTIKCDGSDEEEASAALLAFFKENL